MGYGMIGYHVPHSLYPAGYHCNPAQPLPFVSLASQKNHMALYLMCLYSDPQHEAWFREAWAASGKKLDMGKSCIRFKNLDAVPLEVIGQAVRRVPVRRFIEHYEAAIRPSAGSKRARSKQTPTTQAAVRATKQSGTTQAARTRRTGSRSRPRA
jgi:hypothetical protein